MPKGKINLMPFLMLAAAKAKGEKKIERKEPKTEAKKDKNEKKELFALKGKR